MHLRISFVKEKTEELVLEQRKQINNQSWIKIFVDFSCLSLFSFTTTESDLDYHHQTMNERVASRVAKRLKLGDFKKISEKLGIDDKCTTAKPKTKF